MAHVIKWNLCIQSVASYPNPTVGVWLNPRDTLKITPLPHLSVFCSFLRLFLPLERVTATAIMAPPTERDWSSVKRRMRQRTLLTEQALSSKEKKSKEEGGNCWLMQNVIIKLHVLDTQLSTYLKILWLFISAIWPSSHHKFRHSKRYTHINVISQIWPSWTKSLKSSTIDFWPSWPQSSILSKRLRMSSVVANGIAEEHWTWHMVQSWFRAFLASLYVTQ